MKLKTSIEELRARLDESGIRGDWRDAGDHKHELRLQDGSVLNWWDHTGSFSFGGPKEDRDRLEQRVRGALSEASFATAAGPVPKDTHQVFVVHGQHAAEVDDVRGHGRLLIG